jgi:dephospho-CoA kinase
VPTLGITGGIATGKSSLTKLLSAKLSATVFDADFTARDLLDHDTTVRQQVRTVFGERAYMDSGEANRAHLRETAFSNPEKKRELEQILHPLVRKNWMEMAKTYRNGKEWLIVDIPLLYETEADRHLDKVVVVACGGATQRKRMLNDRKLDADTAEKIIGSQMDLGVKISKADHVVWNDGSQNALAVQAHLLANCLG